MHWQRDPLQHVLAPHDPERFLREDIGRRPLHIPGPPDKFSSLFGWDSLSDLLNRKHPASAALRLVHEQVNYVYPKGPDTLRAVLGQLRNGATLVMENIDRYAPALALLLDALSDQLGLPTHLNLYLSAPGHPGYPLHYDQHDFLILQIHGHKRWEIFPTTPASLGSENQRAGAVAPPPSSRLHNWLLTPGDVLYVPRGYWHQALAEASHSLHLTLGLYPVTGERLLQWLLTDLREDPRLQAHLPVLAKAALPQRADAPSPWQPELAALQDCLHSALQDPTLLLRFHQTCYRTLERRQAFALPSQLLQDPAALTPYAEFEVRQVPRYLVQESDGSLCLSYPAHSLSYPAAAGPLLQALCKHSAISRAELLQHSPDSAQLNAWLLPLVQAGLLVPRAQN
ncbi:MAG: cupin domain-containing protein [Candidatus Sericytochromatia bacterium]